MLFLEIVIARNIPEKLNCNIDLIDLLYQTNGDNQHYFHNHLAVCQNLVPLVNIKIAGKWMFIPLKMVLIGIDPYPFKNFIPTKSWELFDHKCPDVVMIKPWDVMVHDGQNSQTLG